MIVSYNVKLNQTAHNDLWSVWRDIASKNEDAADRFIEALQKKIASLNQFPERCAIIPESRDLQLSYRHLLYKKYRVVFKIDGSDVIVLRILYGPRLLSSGMFDVAR